MWQPSKRVVLGQRPWRESAAGGCELPQWSARRSLRPARCEHYVLPSQPLGATVLHASHLARGAACVAIVLLPSPAPAPAVVQQHWVRLGSRAVGSGGDRDIIRTASAGQFKRIRLVVEGGDLELFDVRITFADGTSFSPAGRFSFTAKSRSHVIALPGAARVIRWINFFYRTLPTGGRGKAIVHVYGRR